MILLILSSSVLILTIVVLRLHKNIEVIKEHHKHVLEDKDEEARTLRRRLSSSRRFGGLAPIEPAQSTRLGNLSFETYTKHEDAEGQHQTKTMYRISNTRTGAVITFSDTRLEAVIIALRAARRFNES